MLWGGALDVNNTPLPNSIGTRTGIKEMSEPQAKTEGRLREARYLEKEGVVLS